MAGKCSGDRRKPAREGREERRPGEVDPGRRHRLQGCRHPPQVHLGAREDPRPSHHRCLRAGAAPHRPRRQERARDGAPALRRAPAAKEHDNGKADSHARGHRPRHRRRRGRGQERLRPQLPDPPGLRRGVDPRWREAGRADQGRPRGPRAALARRRAGPQGQARVEQGQAGRQGRPRRPPLRLGQDGGCRGCGHRPPASASSTSARSRSPTPIKSVGEHEATVRLRDELSATITLQVVAAK